jgi:hypothetical protein
LIISNRVSGIIKNIYLKGVLAVTRAFGDYDLKNGVSFFVKK